MTMTADQTITQLAHLLAPNDVKLGKMFGLRCLLLGRKPLVVLSGDSLVFRVPLERSAEALAIPGATAWEPMPGRGRMKEWIIIPFQTMDAARDWAQVSLEFVQSK